MSPHRYPIPFSFSPYADELSLWLQTVLDKICYDDTTFMRPEVEKKMCGKVNNMSPPPTHTHTLSLVFPLQSLFGPKLLRRADGTEGQGLSQKKKPVGVKNLIALISVLAAHPFS